MPAEAVACAHAGLPKCCGDLRIITFINEGPVIREILGHLGEPTSPTSGTGARSAAVGVAGGRTGRTGNRSAGQPAPDYEFDQRVAW